MYLDVFFLQTRKQSQLLSLADICNDIIGKQAADLWVNLGSAKIDRRDAIAILGLNFTFQALRSQT